MYDTMRNMICHHASTSDISRCWQQTDDIREHMLYFLENHDEQRIASDFFAARGDRGIPGLIALVLMQQNPFMLYAGQEYGERGMDREGFSGNDGRTTIFDYWSIDTLCRAASNKLTQEEKALFDSYKRILQIARKEVAVGSGVFFDLMYVNGHLSRQYAFLRKFEKDLLLVVANFDDQDANIDVFLPSHAFDYLKIGEKKSIAHDLLTKDKLAVLLKRDGGIRMDIPANSGRIWKLKV